MVLKDFAKSPPPVMMQKTNSNTTPLHFLDAEAVNSVIG
jgi:hypothetical protein